jgi:flagellar biosynthesis protein FlhB
LVPAEVELAEAADDDAKTEDPSDRKISDAREKGNEPVSHEVQLLFGLVAITISLMASAQVMAAQLKSVLTELVARAGAWSLATPQDATALLQALGGAIALGVAPFIVVMAVAGISAAVLQNPIALRWQRITPDPSRISPVSGMKRIFGTQGLASFARTVVKLCVAGVVAIVVLRRSKDTLLLTQMMDAQLLPQFVLALITDLLASVTIAAVAIAAADVGWTRWSWHKSLRMTRQEVKDEHKQADGDPAIKARVAAIARERSRRRMMSAVPKATLVVVNPTHYAVALRYQRSEGGAPLVVARGVDEIALKIRRLAESHDVPVIEDVGLARALYEKTKVDQVIPAEFYAVIARLLSVLYASKSPGPKTARRLPNVAP